MLESVVAGVLNRFLAAYVRRSVPSLSLSSLPLPTWSLRSLDDDDN